MVKWRRASGERRQQLNWLMAGGAAALVTFVAALFASAAHGGWQVVADFVMCGMATLPATIGVGILKYRVRYDGDRTVEASGAWPLALASRARSPVQGSGLSARPAQSGDTPRTLAAQRHRTWHPDPVEGDVATVPLASLLDGLPSRRQSSCDAEGI